MMHPILIKAFEAHYNDFFKLTTEEQDIWKLSEHDDIDKNISQFVKKELDFPEDDISPNKTFEYNCIMLHYMGIGPNKFMLNECTWDSKILSYNSLYEFNKDNHEYQEHAIHEEDSTHEIIELYNRFDYWARVEIDKKFNYLNLFSLQMWLYWEIDEVCDVWIEEQIPHNYVAGENHNKEIKDVGIEWNMVLNAGGKEQWHKILNNYRYELLNDLIKNCIYIRDAVYIINTTELDTDPNKHYIFGSLNVLKQIKFPSFIEDCNAIQGDVTELYALKNTIIMETKQKLSDKLAQIKKQYTPNST